jgi:transaldolase
MRDDAARRTAMTLMAPALVDSPLSRMVERTASDYWNDSCAVAELVYAIERGAVGATSNPTIVVEVMQKEKQHWTGRVRSLAGEHHDWTELQLTWAIVEEMAVRGAALLQPVFERESGRVGRLSIQTDPSLYPDSGRMLEQGLHFATLAPNIQVKFPATSAGLVAIEEATFEGVSINATVSFTVAQALAVGEAVERGLRRREQAGFEVASVRPVCTLMIGRLDDWLKVIADRDDIAADPNALDWAGIAVFKRAYGLYQERGYRTRLLSAAFRHRLHWTELVGGDIVMTMPHLWQVRFNGSGIDPQPRMDIPVDPAIVDELTSRFPDFVAAYEPDGLSLAGIDTFGATVRTLRGFVRSYHDLIGAIRDIALPDPDKRA